MNAYKYNKIIYNKKNNNYETINNKKNISCNINNLIFMKYENRDGIYTKIINRFGKTTLNCVTLE